MSFWEKLKSAWNSFWGSKFGLALRRIGEKAAKSGGDQLFAIALAAVTTLASSDMSNAEKREAAFKKVAEDAKKQGIEAKENIIQITVLAAVDEMKQALVK